MISNRLREVEFGNSPEHSVLLASISYEQGICKMVSIVLSALYAYLGEEMHRILRSSRLMILAVKRMNPMTGNLRNSVPWQLTSFQGLTKLRKQR